MKNPPDKNVTVEASSGVFTSTLSAMHGGKVLTELDDALRDVTAAVLAAGKKGKVTLHLTVTPNGVGAGDTPLLKVEDEIRITVPRMGRKPSVFFADEDNNLSRRNPKQEELKLSEVRAPGALGQGQAGAARTG